MERIGEDGSMVLREQLHKVALEFPEVGERKKKAMECRGW